MWAEQNRSMSQYLNVVGRLGQTIEPEILKKRRPGLYSTLLAFG